MEMNEKQIKIVDAVRNAGFNRMHQLIEEEFRKGFTIDEVWAALTETTDIIKDVVWETRKKGNSENTNANS